MVRDPLQDLGDNQGESYNPFRGIEYELVAVVEFWFVGFAAWVLGVALEPWVGYAFLVGGYIVIWRAYIQRARHRDQQ